MHAFAQLRPQYFKKKSSNFFVFFFRAQAVEEALRKDRDCPVEKETPKRKGDKRPRRSAAPSSGCGSVIELAVLKYTRVWGTKKSGISRNFERVRGMSENKRNDARAVAHEARYGCWRIAAEERKQNPKLGRAAAGVRDGWNRRTKIMKNETESNTGWIRGTKIMKK